MTVEEYHMLSEHTCKVVHSIPGDPTMGVYRTLLMVVESANIVIVKTPLACPQPISNVEVQSAVQLLLRRPVTVGTEELDKCDHLDEPGCPRCWQTFGITLG